METAHTFLDGDLINEQNSAAHSYTARSLFKTNTKHAFKFVGEVMQFYAEPGTEAMLVVDLKHFPEGVSIQNIELTDIEKKAIDWSFELVVEKCDGTTSRLSPFDLVQIKRGHFDYHSGELSHVARIRFDNTAATIASRFNIGFIQIL